MRIAAVPRRGRSGVVAIITPISIREYRGKRIRVDQLGAAYCVSFKDMDTSEPVAILVNAIQYI